MNELLTGGSVPVPNSLFDELLPKLNDSELRLLLVVVRSTLGWRESNGQGGWRYKRRDWLTNRLLMKRTGCGSASVSRAVQSLVSAGLIRVESAAGLLLDTPQLRKRNMGRLYFRLGDNVDKWKTSPPRDIGQGGTTTETRDNKIRAPARSWPTPGRVPARPGSGFNRAGQVPGPSIRPTYR